MAARCPHDPDRVERIDGHAGDDVTSFTLVCTDCGRELRTVDTDTEGVPLSWRRGRDAWKARSRWAA